MPLLIAPPLLLLLLPALILCGNLAAIRCKLNADTNTNKEPRRTQAGAEAHGFRRVRASQETSTAGHVKVKRRSNSGHVGGEIRHLPFLESRVRTVAKWLVCRHFAATEVLGLRLLGCKRHRRELTALVRTVTERLFLTFATGTPVVTLASFDLDRVRGLLCDGGLHEILH